jgi:putative hemolysin
MSPHDSITPSLSLPSDYKLIDLRSALPSKPPWRLLRGLIGSVEYILAIDKINAIHRSLPTKIAGGAFCCHVLKEMKIDYSLTEEELSGIDASGPLVMVANHPFGGVEGIIL